ncbi:hypothetical protein [Streptomyces lydicus]|uniref:hypothetical protein n=1 Tax=Streptomyces lydicus TaxID=47763 RepID=UPI0037910EC1
MLRRRLHAAAAAVVICPLQVLDRLVYAWHQLRDRHLHRELARLDASSEAAAATAEQLLADAHTRLAPLYNTPPHVTT